MFFLYPQTNPAGCIRLQCGWHIVHVLLGSSWTSSDARRIRQKAQPSCLLGSHGYSTTTKSDLLTLTIGDFPRFFSHSHHQLIIGEIPEDVFMKKSPRFRIAASNRSGSSPSLGLRAKNGGLGRQSHRNLGEPTVQWGRNKSQWSVFQGFPLGRSIRFL